MKRDQVLAIATAHQAELQDLGVKFLELFASVARDEARPDSDVNFLVEFAITTSMLDIFRVSHRSRNTQLFVLFVSGFNIC